ncbi:ABC transporter permease [Carbonactinospora thermoautotrophica]|uniref:ABC transporter permease n=1 Tax=Carbonactinospora thermoautotrophica TaxID=1469144 RepID=UPI00226E8598|nr:ABC transporter permease [Carbonactinospora thermoautotrophica]MCX9192372.1 ABC transporter permease [Carbonactinospora thermoautotrophica]
MKSQRLAAVVLPAGAIAVSVTAWWLVTGVWAADDRLLSAFAPQHAIPAVVRLAEQGVLGQDIATSLWRLLVGLLTAGVVGVALGLALGASYLLDTATRPVFQFLRMISPLSWAPVAIGLYGIGHRPVYFLIVAAAVWPVALNTAQGVRAIDHKLLLVARSLGASRMETLSTIVFPAIRGHLLTGLRLALGIGWVVLVPAEMLGVTSGLGYEILNSRDQLAYDQVMALILVIGLLGYLLDTLARWTLTPRRRTPRRPATPGEFRTTLVSQ